MTVTVAMSLRMYRHWMSVKRIALDCDTPCSSWRRWDPTKALHRRLCTWNGRRNANALEKFRFFGFLAFGFWRLAIGVTVIASHAIRHIQLEIFSRNAESRW